MIGIMIYAGIGMAMYVYCLVKGAIRFEFDSDIDCDSPLIAWILEGIRLFIQYFMVAAAVTYMWPLALVMSLLEVIVPKINSISAKKRES